MNFLYSQARAEDCSQPTTCSGGAPSATSTTMNTANESWLPASQTEACQKRPSSAISAHSSMRVTPRRIRDWLMSSAPDSRVSHSALPASGSETRTSETCGQKQLMSFASLDRNSSSWKTAQASLLPDTSGLCSLTWPSSGLMLDGACYPQKPVEPPISGDDSGSPHLAEFLTPTVKGDYNRAGLTKKSGDGLATQCRHLLATPQARDWHGYKVSDAVYFNEAKRGRPLNEQIGRANHQAGGLGFLEFREWMMGWPIGWTALQPLATARLRRWLRAHGKH